MKERLDTFILDVDGVMTTGQFLYSEEGKSYKIFGPHDSDGLSMVRDKLKIMFVTADHRGFGITSKRIVEDLGYELHLVSEAERSRFFDEHVRYNSTAFMGDGYFDAPILSKCLVGIAPSSGRREAREAADYVTPSPAGDGAVLDACLFLMERYFCQPS
jgi:3-deoxy-D-manno-octulosonate 8-phosphate phosphatase (KDO 8-P phosphatase)